MKKRIIRIICLGVCFVLLFMFSSCVAVYGSCFSEYDKVYKRDVVSHEHVEDAGYQRPEFSTKYTEEEHIERLHELAMEKLYRKYATADYRYEIYTVYSFQLEPEYFLIQEYAQHLISNKLVEEPSRYWMGFIENDEYYIIVNDFYGSIVHYGEDIEDNLYVYNESKRAYIGENPYSINGVLDQKKFYGGFGQFAWIENDMFYVLESFEESGSKRQYVYFSNPKPFVMAGARECRFVYYDQRILFDEI